MRNCEGDTPVAQRVNIILEDDLDGTEATETVTFGLDGTTYEIDLNEKHAEQLRKAFSKYVEHARKVSSGSRRAAKKSASAGGPTPGEVRDWARKNGYEVSDRGRVHADIRAAYDAAH